MKRNWKKFKDLSKGEKIFRSINLALMIFLFLGCIGLGIYNACIGDPRNRVFSCFMLSLVILLPFLFEIIFGRRLSNLMFLLYQIYIVLAGGGSVLDIYNGIPYYDKYIHVIAGYVFALLGMFIISLFDDYYKFKPLTIAFICFAFTLAVALCWELMEWFADSFLGQTAQGEPILPYGVPLVTDTVSDMLCNFCGGLVFVVHYILGKYTKASLGIKFYEKEFVFNKKTETFENKLEVNTSENDEKNDKSDKKEWY